MRFKANPTEVEAHKIVSVLPKDANGITTVYADDLGKVDLTAKECGKYDAGVGDFIVVEDGENMLLPADVLNARYSSVDAKPVDDASKKAQVQQKQNQQPDNVKEGDVHTFLDDKNKASV